MSFPPGTEMFQFPGFASHTYVFSAGSPVGGVSPFGHPRINDRSHLPAAFRSVPRPSSPLGAKASTERPCLTHHPNTKTPARSTKPRNKHPSAKQQALRLPNYTSIPRFTCKRSPARARVSETRRHLRRFWKHASRAAHKAGGQIHQRSTTPVAAVPRLAVMHAHAGNRLRHPPGDFSCGCAAGKMEANGFEPMTPCLQSRCSTS